MKRTIILSAALFLASAGTPGSALPYQNDDLDASNKGDKNENENKRNNLRGGSRHLNNDYVNPLQWLNEDASNPSNVMSCVIRQANVPNGQGLLLTADGGTDVSLQPRRGDLSPYTIFNPNNSPNNFLSVHEFNRDVNMFDHDDDSGRQLWRFNHNPHNTDIIYDHQFEIGVAAGVRHQFSSLGPVATMLANWGGGPEHVQLARYDEVGSGRYGPVTWELIDCLATQVAP
ncbi:MAG: hypothetical protein SGARI_003449 [Bacillariaceae sp.]